MYPTILLSPSVLYTIFLYISPFEMLYIINCGVCLFTKAIYSELSN